MSLHGGNVYDYGFSDRMLDFSSNINPYGPPEYALAAAREALGAIARYPDARQTAIREAFGPWLGVVPDSLVFGNGASELIAALFAALRPKRVLVVSPTFAEYAICAERLHLDVVRLETCERDGFSFPLERIEAVFSPGDIFVACQPNNPTGCAWSRDELEALSLLAEARGGWLMADECFINLTTPAAASCLDMIYGGRVLVLRAITKDFSAPGLRIGFLVAEASIISSVRRELQPWPLNNVGEAFAIACARDPEPFLTESRAKIARERARLVGELQKMGYGPFPAAANYLLVKSPRMRGAEIQSRLLEHGVLVRRCDNFPSLDDSFFRIAVRSKVDNDKLLFALAAI